MNYSVKSPPQQSVIPNGALSGVHKENENVWNNTVKFFSGGSKKTEPAKPTKEPTPLTKASPTLCKRKKLETASFKAVSNTIDAFTKFDPEVEEIKNFSVNLLGFKQISASHKANINRDIAGMNAAVLQINDAKSKKDKCGMLVGFQNYVNNINQLARDAHDAGGSIGWYAPTTMKRAGNPFYF
jgi:hypothetical protein